MTDRTDPPEYPPYGHAGGDDPRRNQPSDSAWGLDSQDDSMFIPPEYDGGAPGQGHGPGPSSADGSGPYPRPPGSSLPPQNGGAGQGPVPPTAPYPSTSVTQTESRRNTPLIVGLAAVAVLALGAIGYVIGTSNSGGDDSTGGYALSGASETTGITTSSTTSTASSSTSTTTTTSSSPTTTSTTSSSPTTTTSSGSGNRWGSPTGDWSGGWKDTFAMCWPDDNWMMGLETETHFIIICHGDGNGRYPSGSYYYASESKDGAHNTLELEATQGDDNWWRADNGSYRYWANPQKGLRVHQGDEEITDEPAVFGILNAG